MDAELRDDLSGVGYWLDTSGLTVDQTVDRLLATGIKPACWITDKPVEILAKGCCQAPPPGNRSMAIGPFRM